MAAINALFLSIFLIILDRAQSQNRVTPEAPAPASDSCNGIFISYSYDGGRRLPPNRPSDRARQPYRFQSSFTVLNNDAQELKSWRVFVGFQHDEYLVSATNAVLADGSAMPGAVGNGSLFAGFPNPDLATAIETAGDSTQMSVLVELVGTQFGVGTPNVPMPANISLVNDGWICPRPTMRGNGTMQVCCARDANATSNTTLGDEFLPRRDGDLTIMYDVTQTYPSDYWAQVTIENHNSLGRLDNWRLSWDWMEDEFIFAMRGAYPSVVDTSDCIFGRQGQFYRDLDFSTALNCRRRPTIVDLPLSMTNDTALGMIPFCCRNGTILPPEMDPSRSRSSFRLHVFKMPPNVNRSDLTPPQNWAIQGRLNPDYVCGAPIRVAPSIFADPITRLPGTSTVASWQVVCNITAQARNTSPRCCVSFSAYYNESVIPCRTCACGCPASSARTCSSTGPALLLPSEALLVPFENRSELAAAWARLHRLPLPAPAPCGDHCGVSINWHLLTDYRSGWSARVTLFNWDDDAFPDWFTAVELDRAGPGYEAAYSFNGTSMSLGGHGANDTVFMQGLAGLNYLVGETDGEGRSSGLRVPGKQQSVISFTKRRTPGINVPGGDGFPDRVYFNGEECSLPEIIPTSGAGGRVGSWSLVGVLLAWLVFSW